MGGNLVVAGSWRMQDSDAPERGISWRGGFKRIKKVGSLVELEAPGRIRVCRTASSIASNITGVGVVGKESFAWRNLDFPVFPRIVRPRLEERHVREPLPQTLRRVFPTRLFQLQDASFPFFLFIELESRVLVQYSARVAFIYYNRSSSYFTSVSPCLSHQSSPLSEVFISRSPSH